jgi:CubicO group peptidase (beta-lactamase class C family)
MDRMKPLSTPPRWQLASILLAGGILLGGAISLPAQTLDTAALNRYVAKAAKDWRVPGLAIAVVKDDSLVFASGYGVIEKGKPAPVNEHTRFAVGSTTKAMTVASLAMLVDEGKLRWDEHVTDFFPELQLYDRYATRELTIRDLLTHRTGLPGTDMLWLLPENRLPFSEMIRRLRYIKPSSSFRSNWEYQNVMYAIAGGIVEKVSGMQWDAFVRTRIFAPLGMTETVPLVSSITGEPNVAVPHDIHHDSVVVVPVRTTDEIAPAGSVWSSVSDMSKWMRFILDSGRVGTKRLIKPETFREMVAPEMRVPMNEYVSLDLVKPHFFSYALGWFVQDYNGQTVWMHTGSIDGMVAIIGLLPQKRVGVYVLGNLDHAELRHALMYKVFDMYGASGNGPQRDWSADLQADMKAKREARAAVSKAAAASSTKKPAVTGPSLPLASFAGTYTDSAYGTVRVTLANGALHARYVNFEIGDLEHVKFDSFRSKIANPREGVIDVSFETDGTGGVSALDAFGLTFARVVSPDDRQ